MRKKLRNIAKKGRSIAKKGKMVVARVVKSPVAREIARREIEIVADMLAKAAQKMKARAKKMK